MILITGGGGFLGLNIARALVDEGQGVLLVQRRPIRPPSFLTPFWGKEVKQATGNILDLPFLLGLVKEYDIDSIIHGAFDTASLWDREGPMQEHLHQYVQVPVQGCINVLEAARIFGFRRVTLISSLVAYFGSPGEHGEWREDALLAPVTFSLIGNLKKAMEQVSFLYSDVYKLSLVCLRVGWVYGPGRINPDPVTMMLESVLAGRPADLPHVPKDRQSPTVYAKDVGGVTSLIHLAGSLRHPLYNIADGGIPTMLDVAEVIKEIIPKAKITLGPAQPGQPELKRVNIERIKEEFGYAPRDLKAGLADYIDWMKEGIY